MSAGARPSARYLFAKLANALEIVQSPSSVAGSSSSTGSLFSRISEAFNQPMTSVMAITGVAMAPALNPGALANSSAWEKLVVRLIPRPSSRTIGVGDVVAFNSPFNQHDPHGVMVRRVAALENAVMLSSSDEDVQERIPPGHCWVLADNESLAGPPDVIDSRAFGYLDMQLIRGRVVYRVASEEDHGPVANNPQSEAADAAVIESEVDVAALAAGIVHHPAADAKQQQQQQQTTTTTAQTQQQVHPPPPKQAAQRPQQQQESRQRSEQQQEQ